jgi:hypothetical protein
MISRYLRSYLFLTVALIKIPCQCMEVVPHIPLDFWKGVAPYLPKETLLALACTTQDMRKKFEDPYWLKIFNLREARRTTPGTLQYNETNEKLVDLARASTAHGYNRDLYKILLEDPYFDANYSDSNGRTVLMHASKQLSISLTNSLVINRANLNFYTGPNEDSPLSHAIVPAILFRTQTPELLDNQNKTIECLTQLGANINHSTLRNQENYLFYAINLRILSVVPTLLACGINPNHKRGDGMTPLGFMVKTFPRIRSTMPPQEIVDSTIIALMQAAANPYEPFRNGREASILEICNWQNAELALVMQNNLQGDADWYKNNGPKY